MWLEPIPVDLRDVAMADLDAGDVELFLFRANNEASLSLVYRNQAALRARGLYERALLNAFVATRTNNRRWPLDTLASLFVVADVERLRAAGDPLPGPGPFTVYRGVAGRGRARRVRGISWTLSLEKARWFANRFGYSDPAVFQVTINMESVLAYINTRGEQELIVLLPASVTTRRSSPPGR